MTECPERRRAVRLHALDRHGIVRARVRPGHDVQVVDVSGDGVLIETDRRLLPGAAIELQIATGARTAAVRGKVLRSTVARLRPSSIAYRSVVCFDQHLPWFVEEDDIPGYPVPGIDGGARNVR